MGNTQDAKPLSRLHLDPASLATIERASLVVYPEEACGLLLGSFRPNSGIRVDRAIQLPNHAAITERRKRFEIDPRLLLNWDRVANEAGLSIVGFFHSHPDQEPWPSATDVRLAWPSYAYLIAGVSRTVDGSLILNGMAAWTFDESSTSFRELSVEVDIGPDKIEYFI